MGFHVYATTNQRLAPKDLAAHAQRAEAIGYDGLNIPEAVHDGFVAASVALQATEKIRVATSVALAFPRSPMVVAIAAWDLAHLSGSRFELGLGSQVRGNIEGRYSTKWTSPVPRMREYLGSLRAIFESFQTGAELDYRGEIYQFTRMQPFFRPDPLDDPYLPLCLGGVGPKMTTLAGEISDGLVTHPTNSSPRYLTELIRPRLVEGALSSGRDMESFRLMVGCRVATGKTAGDVARERENARRSLAFLYSTPAYWGSLELFGWRDRGEALRELSRSGKWVEMEALVDDEMLDAFVAAAPYDEIAAILKEWYGGISDSITFPMPEDPADDVLASRVIESLRG